MNVAPRSGDAPVRLMWSVMSTGVPGVHDGFEPAAAVGQHDDAAPGGRRGAHAVHDRLDPAPLVVVRAAEEDQRPALARLHAADAPGVAGDRGRREVRQVGDGEVGHRLADEVDGRHPARAEHERDVVALHPGEAGELGRGLAGGGGRVGLQEVGAHAPDATHPRAPGQAMPRVREPRARR